MDSRTYTQAILELNKILQDLNRRTTSLLNSLENWDPLHAPLKEIVEDVHRAAPMANRLLPFVAPAEQIDPGYRFAGSGKPVILYVDDNNDRLTLLRSVLELNGYDVFTAEYGRKGLELFLSEPIELVILDYHMPGMDGEQVATKMRQLRPGVPILIFSGSLSLPDKVIAQVDGFISTAQDPDAVLEKIRMLLGRAKSKAS